MTFNEVAKKIEKDAEFYDIGLKDSKGELFAGIRYQFLGRGFNKVYLKGTASTDENYNFHIMDPRVYETLEEAIRDAIICFTGKEKFKKYDTENLFRYQVKQQQRLYLIEILPITDNSDGQKHIHDNDFFKYLDTVIESEPSSEYCSCGEQLVKEHRRSPISSWNALAGRQGWFTFCPKCGLLHGNFECTMMS